MLVRFGSITRKDIKWLRLSVELTPFAFDACCRLPKRKATRENFIGSVLFDTII